jgi:hypothetical protein
VPIWVCLSQAQTIERHFPANWKQEMISHNKHINKGAVVMVQPKPDSIQQPDSCIRMGTELLQRHRPQDCPVVVAIARVQKTQGARGKPPQVVRRSACLAAASDPCTWRRPLRLRPPPPRSCSRIKGQPAAAATSTTRDLHLSLSRARVQCSAWCLFRLALGA